MNKNNHLINFLKWATRLSLFLAFVSGIIFSYVAMYGSNAAEDELGMMVYVVGLFVLAFVFYILRRIVESNIKLK